MRKVDEAKEKINKMLENHEDNHEDQGNAPPPPPPPSSKRHDGPLSEGEERDDDDYERWDTADAGDNANKKVKVKKEEKLEYQEVRKEDSPLEGKDHFIERMKQRSKNVLIKREAAARVW